MTDIKIGQQYGAGKCKIVVTNLTHYFDEQRPNPADRVYFHFADAGILSSIQEWLLLDTFEYWVRNRILVLVE